MSLSAGYVTCTKIINGGWVKIFMECCGLFKGSNPITVWRE